MGVCVVGCLADSAALHVAADHVQVYREHAHRRWAACNRPHLHSKRHDLVPSLERHRGRARFRREPRPQRASPRPNYRHVALGGNGCDIRSHFHVLDRELLPRFQGLPFGARLDRVQDPRALRLPSSGCDSLGRRFCRRHRNLLHCLQSAAPPGGSACVEDLERPHDRARPRHSLLARAQSVSAHNGGGVLPMAVPNPCDLCLFPHLPGRRLCFPASAASAQAIQRVILSDPRRLCSHCSCRLGCHCYCQGPTRPQLCCRSLCHERRR
eukprot:Amastigsp_a340811_34.p3 type:complete len:268 gc:universal Amastigsp_a340811_34:1014-211(-)